jgi:hypothetical protein
MISKRWRGSRRLGIPWLPWQPAEWDMAAKHALLGGGPSAGVVCVWCVGGTARGEMGTSMQIGHSSRSAQASSWPTWHGASLRSRIRRRRSRSSPEHTIKERGGGHMRIPVELRTGGWRPGDVQSHAGYSPVSLRSCGSMFSRARPLLCLFPIHRSSYRTGRTTDDRPGVPGLLDSSDLLIRRIS